jgi:tellurite resistance-related uncharacterized protein
MSVMVRASHSLGPCEASIHCWQISASCTDSDGWPFTFSPRGEILYNEFVTSGGNVMKQLPETVTEYKRTNTFTEKTIPSGLLKSHSTKSSVWGKIVVLEGELLYRILEPAIEDHMLTPEVFGVVEPEVLHEVKPLGKVSFYVVFLK